MAERIFLSAGHGGNDPGAAAYGLKEKDINLRIMLACRNELVRHGVEVVTSRMIDENDTVDEEVREAIESGVELAVSFHTNAGGGDGFEAYCNTANPDGVKLCKLAEKHVKALGQNSRGVKDGVHLYFIRKTPMTSALFEGFFVDNNTDNNFGDTVAEQKKIGVAYAKAILEYMDIEYKESGAGKPDADKKLYRVQVGAFAKKAGADRMLETLKAAGFDGFTNYSSEDKLYRVQTGAYSILTNAENMKQRVIAAGFSAFIKED